MSQEHTVSHLPKHVAIIMDGNGRWAQQKGRRRIWGHRQGAISVREVVRASREIGIQVLTLFAFSEENWQRPKEEVAALMHLLNQYMKNEEKEMIRNGIRLHAIGSLRKLPERIQESIRRVQASTAQNRDMALVLALSYGGREEIVRAARLLARECVEGKLTPEDIDEELFSSRLYTAGFPDPDLLIRTSGEQRVSNFLLWQISYAELVITPVLWPDFRKAEFLAALQEYQHRRRRFGKIDAQLPE